VRRFPTHPLLLATITLLIMGFGVSCAEGAESEPSSTVGFQQVVLVHGWNLISFPLADGEEMLANLFMDALEGDISEINADRVFWQDPESGGWLESWAGPDGYLVGILATHLVTPEDVYWVQIREAHPDSVSLVMTGAQTAETDHPRGAFEAGVHLISSYWPAEQMLDQTGLTEAGMEASPLFFGPHPETGTGPDALYGWDPAEQRFVMAFHDGSGWRGELDRLVPGRGYLLYLNEAIDWTSNPRPGLPGPAVMVQVVRSWDLEPAGSLPKHKGVKLDAHGQTGPPLPLEGHPVKGGGR